MTLLTDRLRAPALQGPRLIHLLSYLAAAIVLMLPLAFKGPAMTPVARFVDARLYDGHSWRPVDVGYLRLPAGRVSQLRTKVYVDPAAAASGAPLGLYLSGTFAASASWNGEALGGKGRPGATRAQETPGPVDAVLELPRRAVRPGLNDLTLDLSAAYLTHPVRSVVHGEGDLFGIRVAPFSAEVRRPIGHYAAPFVMSGVLLLALATLALRGDGRTAGAVFLGGLALMALAEMSRSVITYAYPWHDVRMTAVAVGANLAGVGMLLHAQAVAGFMRWPRLRVVAAVIGVAAIDVPLALTLNHTLAAAALVGAAATIRAGVQRRPGAAELSVALLVFAVMALCTGADFLDRGLYAAAAPLVVCLVRRRTAPPLLAVAPPTTPFADRLAVGPADARRYIPFTAIRAIHGAGDYAELRLAGGERVLHAETLAALERRLPDGFFRVHRSHLVNLQAVTALQAQGGGRYRLRLADDTWLPVSRARVGALRARLEA